MDSACGPPEAMADKREELTPMMGQYHNLCARYDDAIVLFQVGDFYETFCGAAERTARLLELTLTSREDSTGEYPMTGIPVDNAASYVEGLLEAGYRVAIAEQVEEPGESQGVVERAVTRVITPGTLTEDELLSSDDNNFVAAVARDGAQFGLAFLDVSTGDFLATSATDRETIADELSRFSPAEAVVGPDAPAGLLEGDGTRQDCLVTPYDEAAFDLERAAEHVATYFGNPDRLLASDAEIAACGALLSYAEYARGGIAEDVDEESMGADTGTDTSVGADTGTNTGAGTDTDPATDTPLETNTPTLEYLTHLTRYDPREYLLLDAVALRSLELFEPRSVDGHEEATLVGVLDQTASALGGRQLKDWVRRPLLEPAEIEARLDAVDTLRAAVQCREELTTLLRAVYDLERLIGRISRERANARDLQALGDTLLVVPEVRETLCDISDDADRLEELHERLDPLSDVRTLIESAIAPNPPAEITEGGIIAEGYDGDLDDLRATARDGKQWIETLEETERERTGIDSLKVGYTSVHGYYIEVTNPNLEAVPEEYQRRQTLKRAERFVTPELKERESAIIGAEGRADEREYELFCAVRRAVADEVERVQALADAIATLDALCSLATVAAQYDYCRPTIVDGAPELTIEAGRHPVVERTQSSFVPNDTALGSGVGVGVGVGAGVGGMDNGDSDGHDDQRLAIITGPNMSGKSTYMRQVALITLLAQIGSFVPAERATIRPLERIFTRVGASDDIAGGRSTFMIEMDELATILREADERSLVLLDEVGRGTSTADGLAIAQAITEHLHEEVGAMTLFATHHHPLTELADDLGAAFTLHFSAGQEDGEVVFGHTIAPGAATGSYGVEVATAAGVPEAVLERSRALLEGPNDDVTGPSHADTLTAQTATADGGDDPTDLAAELRALEIAHLTPVEALAELDRLQRLLE